MMGDSMQDVFRVRRRTAEAAVALVKEAAGLTPDQAEEEVALLEIEALALGLMGVPTEHLERFREFIRESRSG